LPESEEVGTNDRHGAGLGGVGGGGPVLWRVLNRNAGKSNPGKRVVACKREPGG